MSEQHVSEEVIDSVETPPSEVNVPAVQPVVSNGLSSAQTAVESRAKRMGWVPREEFKGDGGTHWLDAQSFVDRAEASAAILIERNRALDSRLDKAEKLHQAQNTTITELTGKFNELTQTMAQFRDFASRAQERAYKRARTDIEAEMQQAVSEADVPKFQKAKAEFDELNQEVLAEASTKPTQVKQEETQKEEPKTEPTVETPTQPPPVAPEILHFVNNNNWFNQDRVLNQYMQEMHLELQRTKPGLNLSQNLEEAKKLVIAKFPEKFNINPRREEPTSVSTSTTTKDSKSKKKTYDDLPAEAKIACDKFVKTIPASRNKDTGKMEPYTREEYVATYFAGEEQE